MYTASQRFATNTQRWQIFTESGSKCHYCGAGISIKEFHVDHKIPFCKGGSTEINNFVASCFMCNVAKYTMDYDHFKKKLSANGVDWRRKRYFAVKSNFKKAPIKPSC